MKVTYEDKVLEINEPQKVIDLFKDECGNGNIIACKCNNQIQSLNHIIKEDSKIEFIDTKDKDGQKIYIRGLTYIMAKALSETYPKALLTVDYQLSNSMFFEIDNMKITDEMIEKIDKRMTEIINQDLPIKKVVMTKEEANEFYEVNKTLKGILQKDIEKRDHVTLYYCEDYYNYFYGVMPISTGYMKIYKLEKYKHGFLIRYPNRKDTTKLQPFVDNQKLLSALQDYENIHRLLDINTLYKLNTKVKNGEAKHIVLLDEALHEKKISQIADKINQNRNVKVVLIAGPSSSGKTTFAQRLGLQLELNGLRPVTISVDNYFVEREDTPKDENGEYDFEDINAIDMELFNNQLISLLNGEEVETPTFNFHTGHKEFNGNKMKLNKNDVLVIEGIHCLNDKLTAQIPKENKFKIYISALNVLNIDYFNRISTTDSRLLRRIVRDYQFRGYSALHTLKMWPSVNRGEEKNIFPYQEEADVMFNTSLIYEISVLKSIVLPLLEEIDNSVPEYSEARRLCDILQYFEEIPVDLIPTNSLLREFLGKGDFKY